MDIENLTANKYFNDIKNELFGIYMPPSDDGDVIKKENAWIVWIHSNDRIKDLKVYELDKDNMDRWKRTVNYVERRLSGINFFDIGCVLNDWNEWTLQDVLYKFGFQYEFMSHDAKLKALNEFERIQEWRSSIKKWKEFWV